MDIIDWFDPENETHLAAYVVLQNTGMWPENFVPEGTEFAICWHVGLIDKMATLWLNYKLGNEFSNKK